MLWTILAIVLVLWLLGFVGGVGGSLIHALLLVAGVVLVLQLLSGRRTSI
ncbi:MAG: lmo0937 family membrane protein [Blastocatellia bacterium]